ncbi:MAG: hypothetical protein IKQ35_06090 [Bacilli bacterium]|nr:hypothetical protein [Bacilli bacterium]
MGNLTTSDMVIVISLVSIILVLVVIIVVLDILNKRNKKEDLEIEKMFEDNKPDVSKVELPSVNTPSRVEEIKYVEEDEELEKTKAKLELLALKEELERQKEKDNLTPLAESVEKEVFENKEPELLFNSEEKKDPPVEVVEPVKEDKPVKYNFDKMVEFVKLENEEELKPIDNYLDDEVRAYPIEEHTFEIPTEVEEEVQIQEAPQVIEEENPVVEEENLERIVEEEPTPEVVNYTPTIREFGPVQVEKIEETKEEPSPIEEKEEVASVEIQEASLEETKEEKPVEIQEIATSINNDLKEVKAANLARVNEIQQDLNELLNSREEEINRHEDMQEENAIISVEALSKLSDEVYDNNENYQMSYEDEGNEPISIRELEQLYNTTDLREVTEVIKNEPELVKEEIKQPTIEFKRLEDLPPISSEIKFKSSPFISPVFGVTETPSSLELEQTANLDKLNDEIKKTNEFLNKLRELQKNLD